MPGSIIIGVGSKSSQFTDKLVQEIISSGLKLPGIVAVGVYTEEQGDPTRKAISRKADRLHIRDITVPPGSDPDADNKELSDLVELQRKVVNFEPEAVLLIIDAKYMNAPRFAEVFHMLRSTLPQNSKMSALCFVDAPRSERDAVERLKEFTVESPTAHNNPILDTVFIARTFDSPLVSMVGGVSPQMDFLARSMAQIWQANRYTNFNPTFNDQVKLMRQSGFTFIGLAIGSTGLSGDASKGFRDRLFKSRLSSDLVQQRLINLAEGLLQNQPEPQTTIQRFDLDMQAREHPVTINVIAPLRTRDPRFDAVRNGLLRALRERHYQIAHISMIPGNGVPIWTKQQTSEAGQPGYGQPEYGDDALARSPAHRPQQRPPDAPPPSAPRANTGVVGVAAANQDGQQNNMRDRFIGQVCILFGITPEQI